MRNFKILHPVKGQIDYIPTFYQQRLIKVLDRGENVTLVSDRQMGTSTTIRYYVVNKCLENKYNAVIFRHNPKESCKIYTDYLRNNQILFIPHNPIKIEFMNGSSIEFISGNDLLCSREVCDSDIFVEDSLWFKHPDELFKLLCMSMKNSQIRVWHNTDVGLGHNFIYWPWHIHDGWDDKWKEDQIRMLGKEGFETEMVTHQWKLPKNMKN